ncbi:MAG: glutamate-cysteine ligase family protein [Acidobacteriota bacterium]
MGRADVEKASDPAKMRIFMQRLLEDVHALQAMLDDDLFERGAARIGAEQELFLVDDAHRPASAAMAVLEEVDDPHFTTELARFNLEINLDPVDLFPDGLSRLERQLVSLLAKARGAAEQVGVRVLLTGILPTLEKADLSLDNMTPVPRYFALNEAARQLRGRDFRFHIKGQDELTLKHQSVMLEACNTSFQVHFQVDAPRFARLYNLAQVASSPVLAAAANSPLLFGNRLWHETRIALFQQAVDTRAVHDHRRRQRPRVSFGDRWLDDSVLEIFREDISRFRLLLSDRLEHDGPLKVLARGELPELEALRLHNGTVYRWNRPCFGVHDGIAHLRIENRILPSGPTVIDEIANGAFWLGLIKGLEQEVGDIRQHLSFATARENFLAAARLGPKAQLHWLGDRVVPVTELVAQELVPLARAGLETLGIQPQDRDRYLDVIEQRMDTGRTGSQWLLDSMVGMGKGGNRSESLGHLAAATRIRQEEGHPVHTWPLARWREVRGWERHYRSVGTFMTTDLFTVQEDEVIDLVANMMDWQKIRHVPVEDAEHRLVGLITHRTLMRVLVRHQMDQPEPVAVRDVMQKQLITVDPDTPTLEAITLMREKRISCLPVVEGDKLVGIVTERDFMELSAQLLEEFLGRDGGVEEPNEDPISDEGAERGSAGSP